MNLFTPSFRAGATLAAAALAVSSCATKPGADFMAADVNQNGSLNQAELNTYIARRFMTTYDANGDGGVTFAEWQMMKPEATREAFAKRDKDGNGKVDSEEMLAAVVASPTFGRLMESIDTNGDGVVQPSEAEEFRKHADEI